MASAAALKARFKNNAVETASPAKLLTLLVERMCLDIARAEQAQRSEDWQKAHSNLVNAQGIVSALEEALDAEWEHAGAQAEIYQFLFKSLIAANLKRDPELTKECLSLAEPIKDMWLAAAAQAAQTSSSSAEYSA